MPRITTRAIIDCVGSAAVISGLDDLFNMRQKEIIKRRASWRAGQRGRREEGDNAGKLSGREPRARTRLAAPILERANVNISGEERYPDTVSANPNMAHSVHSPFCTLAARTLPRFAPITSADSSL